MRFTLYPLGRPPATPGRTSVAAPPAGEGCARSAARDAERVVAELRAAAEGSSAGAGGTVSWPMSADDPTTLSLTELAAAYRDRSLLPTEVLDAYLERLEPGPVYRLLTPERAQRQAHEAERLFAAGIDIGPLQGVPLAIKDLLDTQGDVTAAGSKVLSRNPPAREDSPVAARLDAAGALFLGKTNMTELAFSGLGLNPHFGTPGNSADGERIPGGSSSGSAVAVAAGLACAAIGSDTGGSVRIPAALNGIVGLKTSDGLVPTDGAVPLSTTLDTIGPMARTIADCWELFLAMTATPRRPLPPTPEGLSLLVPTTVVHDDIDPEVATVFEGACAHLERSGFHIDRQPVPLLSAILDLYDAYGSFASHEALTLYQELIETEGHDMDPRVVTRILAYRGRPATDYLKLVYARRDLQRAFWQGNNSYAAILAPTVPILPPRIADLAEDEAYFRANALCLRNTLLFNFLGGPAASIPSGKTPEGLPVGVMIATRPRQDALALAIGKQLHV